MSAPLPNGRLIPSNQASKTVLRWRQGKLSEAAKDNIALEEPLEIRVQGKSIAVTMRTPGHDEELATGFLLAEGLVKHRREIIEMAPCAQGESALSGNILNVFLAPSVNLDLDQLTRHVFASSSCGLCGKASIESVHQQFPPARQEGGIRADRLLSLPEKMLALQQGFETTGGLHAAALFDLDGELLALREDVGRHNAVDKIIGLACRRDLVPLTQSVLLVSGRASFEIMQKALAARIPIVAAVSAPSSLAVEFAEESGQALVGFLRADRFNIYAHPERVLT